eukprot:2388671-Rhodomonas_salina.1
MSTDEHSTQHTPCKHGVRPRLRGSAGIHGLSFVAAMPRFVNLSATQGRSTLPKFQTLNAEC